MTKKEWALLFLDVIRAAPEGVEVYYLADKGAFVVTEASPKTVDDMDTGEFESLKIAQGVPNFYFGELT